MSHEHDDGANARLNGTRVAFVGKLAGMSKRDAAQLIRQHGGMAVEPDDAIVHLIVVGEGELPLDSNVEKSLIVPGNAAVDADREVINETQLWQRLGLLDYEQNIHKLYTPAILADLVGVPVAVIRRWHRRGLIVPAREVRRLPYFDFQEVAAARRLAELLAAGVKPHEIERKLAALAKFLPSIQRPLAQLSIIVEGKELLLRQGGGLLAAGGQRWFDFDETKESAGPAESRQVVQLDAVASQEQKPASIDAMLDAAADLEETGELLQAADTYRAILAAGGPKAEVCFLLAELLYRLGDITAARERYYMAIELDDDYVEARANLGCVLQEIGQQELALAAFEGALAYHPDYPDAHYHLARTLEDLGRGQEAVSHWEAFIQLAPESPWALEAQTRLQEYSDLGS